MGCRASTHGQTPAPEGRASWCVAGAEFSQRRVCPSRMPPTPARSPTTPGVVAGREAPAPARWRCCWPHGREVPAEAGHPAITQCILARLPLGCAGAATPHRGGGRPATSALTGILGLLPPGKPQCQLAVAEGQGLGLETVWPPSPGARTGGGPPGVSQPARGEGARTRGCSAPAPQGTQRARDTHPGLRPQ